MTTNVIKQIASDRGDGYQTIKIIVRSNERGPQGEQGEKGEAATIEAGQAYSVPYGAAPAVMNRGTSSNAIFDFYIPQGKPGKDGGGGGGGGGGGTGVIEISKADYNYTDPEEGNGIAVWLLDPGYYKIVDSTGEEQIVRIFFGEGAAEGFGPGQLLAVSRSPHSGIDGRTLCLHNYGEHLRYNYTEDATREYIAGGELMTSEDWGKYEWGFHYSENELKTGESWVDGKPIYKKTFIWYSPNLNEDPVYYINFDFDYTVIDELIDGKGSLRNSGAPIPIPGGFLGGGGGDRGGASFISFEFGFYGSPSTRCLRVRTYPLYSTSNIPAAIESSGNLTIYYTKRSNT